MEMAVVTTAVGVIKLLPEVVDVGKSVWKKLKPPEELAINKGKDGVLGRNYYSGKYRFTISIPDDKWQFWEPSPQFKASFGPIFAVPTRDIPILILSNQMVKLYRSNVVITIEDIGSFTNIQEYTDFTIELLKPQDYQISESDVHVSPQNNSSVFITTQPYFNGTVYQVYKSFLYASRAYGVITSYVPISDESPQLFSGLQDIIDSFKLIK